MERKQILVFIFIALFYITLAFSIPVNKDYTDAVSKIKNAIENDKTIKNHAYETVAYLVDTFGPRLWGSEALEDSINYMEEKLKSDGFDKVYSIDVEIPQKWVRGEESLIMLDPRPFPTKIPMIGLGKTGKGNVTGELVMVQTKQELDNLDATKIAGKIVFINAVWTTYEETYWSRVHGPAIASSKGASGVIIRSVASLSVENPHTGMTDFGKSNPIPAAAISIETADMFKRIIDRGQTVKVNLTTNGSFIGAAKSRNIIAEITGSTIPHEIVLMGGHIDSWDTGPQTGANDDAAGFMVCYSAMRTLLKLGLRPKRTMRFIAWSGEEFGEDTQGAIAYVNNQISQLNNHVVAFESDGGTTHLYGFGITGTPEAFKYVDNIVKTYLGPLGVTTTSKDGEMVDTGYLNEKKVPMMKNIVQDTSDAQYYFTYHHSAGDSMNVLSSDDLDSNVAAIAAMFYIIADSDERLPREFLPSNLQ